MHSSEQEEESDELSWAELEPSGKAATEEPVKRVPSQHKKQWDFFLSHMQNTGELIAHSLYLHMQQQKPIVHAWRDTMEHPTSAGMLAGMLAGIRGSRALLLCCSKGVMSRPYVRFELRLAKAHGLPIVLVHEEKQASLGYFDFGAEMAHCPDDLSHIFADNASTPFRRMKHDAKGAHRGFPIVSCPDSSPHWQV